MSKMKYVIAAALSLSLVFPVNAKTIRHDRGGFVMDYMLNVLRLPSNETVRIMGFCASACTIYLSVPRDKICIGPQVKLLFHAAQLPPEITEDRDYQQRFMNNILMNSYPPFIQAYINRKGGLTTRDITMTYKDLKGYYKKCS